MVFPSVPLYQDPPTWNQQQQIQHHQQNPQHHHDQPYQLQHVPPPQTQQQPLLRPNSTADRARAAKIPLEQALKCPRCESSNTKFCYFNNYSLTQPRHFCKSCRRYWTCGGALRTVPVGGGCRRSSIKKRSSKSSSSSSSSAATSAPSLPPPPPPPPIDYYAAATTNIGLGLGFSGLQQQQQPQISDQQWRINQMPRFPFWGGLDLEAQQQPPPPPQLLSSAAYGFGGQVESGLSSVNMEENLQYDHLSMNPRSNNSTSSGQFWPIRGSTSAAGWMTNLSGFNSSSTGSLL